MVAPVWYFVLSCVVSQDTSRHVIEFLN